MLFQMIFMSMKTCAKCKTEKQETEFCKRTKSKDGLHSMCRECSRKAVRNSYRKNARYYIQKKQERRKEMRRFIEKMKDKPCQDCGKKYPHYVMDFDHLKDKDFCISAKLHSKGIIQIANEIKKCEVVCANCHRVRTHNRNMHKYFGV
jgi:hypothetical protein